MSTTDKSNQDSQNARDNRGVEDVKAEALSPEQEDKVKGGLSASQDPQDPKDKDWKLAAN